MMLASSEISDVRIWPKWDTDSRQVRFWPQKTNSTVLEEGHMKNLMSWILSALKDKLWDLAKFETCNAEQMVKEKVEQYYQHCMMYQHNDDSNSNQSHAAFSNCKKRKSSMYTVKRIGERTPPLDTENPSECEEFQNTLITYTVPWKQSSNYYLVKEFS